MAKPIVVGVHGVIGFKDHGENAADIAWSMKEVLCDSDRAKR